MASDKYQISAIIKVFDEATGPLAKIGKSMSSAAARMQGAGEKMSQWGNTLSTRVTLPLIGALGMAVKYASDTEESLNKVNVAFGESAKQVTAFADKSLKSFGISRQSALDAAAMFGDMGTSMGLSQQKAADMSTSLVGLAGDLASFKNIPIEQAMTALGGVFTGETESLKRLGVVMIDANVKAFALKQGITKSYESMSQAEKVSLRYQYILESTKNSQGDFARTSDSVANKTKTVQESLKQVSATFGKVLLPTVARVLDKLSKFLEWIDSFDEDTKELILTTVLLVAALGPVLKVMGTLINIINMARTATLLFNGALLANPITWIVLAIAGLSYALYKLIFNFEEVRQGAISAWDAVAGFMNAKFGEGTMTRVASMEKRVAMPDLGVGEAASRKVAMKGPFDIGASVAGAKKTSSTAQIDINLKALPGTEATIDGVKKSSNSNLKLNSSTGTNKVSMSTAVRG